MTAGRFLAGRELMSVIGELIRGLGQVELWSYLALRELKKRYTRTVFGPLWITVAMGLWVIGMGTVFSTLLRTEVHELVPWMTCGMVVWHFINLYCGESLSLFMSCKDYIQQSDRSLFVYSLFSLLECVMVSGHHLIVAVAVILYFRIDVISGLPWLLVGVPAFAFGFLWVGPLLSLTATRYRDIQQIVPNTLQFIFFLTPIMYMPQQLGRKSLLVELNPLTHLLALIREPMLGHPVTMTSVLVSLSMGVVGWSATLFMYSRYRHRVAYWI